MEEMKDFSSEAEERLTDNNPALKNIMTRRSVRKYTDDPVTDEEMTVLLKAAMAAPSGVNRQPWEFIVIRKQELKTSLAEKLPYAKMAAEAPALIIVCGNKERFLDGDDATLWVQDVSAASENILLAANAIGLGSVWTCLYPHRDRMDTVTETLSLPADIVPFSLIPVGRSADPHKPMNKWHEDRVHHNGF